MQKYYKVHVVFLDKSEIEITDVTGINYTDAWVQITYGHNSDVESLSLNRDRVFSVLEMVM